MEDVCPLSMIHEAAKRGYTEQLMEVIATGEPFDLKID
jgi:hypothetical protein